MPDKTIDKGQLLTIRYKRVKSSTAVQLTPENCEDYGYVATTKTIEGKEYTLYHKKDDNSNNYLPYEVDEEGNAITTIVVYEYNYYKFAAPPCSNFKINFGDVDKEGSGRNELTGEMFRERLGSYNSINLTWDLIPNTELYNKWYHILTHLPPNFEAYMLMPTGRHESKTFYRADVSTDLYLWTDGKQIWKGLSTDFIQWNIDPYNDELEEKLTAITEQEWEWTIE